MKLSLAKINFLNILMTALLFTISVGFLEVYISHQHFDNDIQKFKEKYISNKKLQSEEQVKKMVSRIQDDISSRYKTLELTLKDKVNDITYIYDDLQKDNLQRSKTEIISLFTKKLDTYRTTNNLGCFYIFDKHKKLLYHGSKKEFIGKKLNDFKIPELNKIIKIALEKGESSGTYSWLNTKKPDMKHKFIYIKNIKNTDLYIGATFYSDLIEEEIKSNIKNIILTNRFGLDKKGYFWIHSLKGNIVYHPMYSVKNGKFNSEYENVKIKSIFKDMNEMINEYDSGFINYLWKYPNDNNDVERKISYVQKLNYNDWVIGSGFYFREQIDAIKKEEENLKKELTNRLFLMFLLLGLVFTGSIFIAYFISKKITKIEKDKKTHLNMLEQYKIVLDESSIVSKTNKDGFIIYVNDRFTEVCGYSAKELIGKSHNILRHSSMPKELFNEMWKKISKGLIWSGIIKNRKKDGSSYYINTTVLPVKDELGDIVEYISASSDITKLITTNNLLENFTLTDGLTGLGSRVKLMNDLQSRQKSILAIVDIIKFTEVNDMYGQKVGDKIIREVGHEIFGFAKENSMQTYRLHADVFALLADTSTDKFILQINTLVKYLKEYHFDKDDTNVTFDFIAGISEGNNRVLAHADMALKNAKRNHIPVGVYSKDNTLLEEYKNNEKWMKIVTKALKDDRIIPYFQPIYSYKNKRIEKYEALMRLIDEDGNVVTPFSFLDVIKKTSIYPKITQTMIRKTVDTFRYTSQESFSINITLEDLLNEETMQYFYSVVSAADLFERLIIEIVESEELINFEKVGDIIGKFKARGAKIAIDDFGTGYSNYNYLIKLDIDFIKIDGSIIENISDLKTREIISTILDFAKKSSMETIAEFVSSKEIDESVQTLGVDYAQGYFRGKPSPSIKIL